MCPVSPSWWWNKVFSICSNLISPKEPISYRLATRAPHKTYRLAGRAILCNPLIFHVRGKTADILSEFTKGTYLEWEKVRYNPIPWFQFRNPFLPKDAYLVKAYFPGSFTIKDIAWSKFVSSLNNISSSLSFHYPCYIYSFSLLK